MHSLLDVSTAACVRVFGALVAGLGLWHLIGLRLALLKICSSLSLFFPLQYWHHALPGDSQCKQARYNLTFRRVLTADEDPTLLSVENT